MMQASPAIGSARVHQSLTCKCNQVAYHEAGLHTLQTRASPVNRPVKQHTSVSLCCIVHATHGEVPACSSTGHDAAPWTTWTVDRSATRVVATGLIAALLLSPGYVEAVEQQTEENIKNIPQQLQAQGEERAPRLSQLMAGAKKAEIEGCTRRCVPTCLRGGEGAPGLGPITVRKEIVVFKEGFRSRSYCLSECATVCSLSIKGPSTPATP